jgi:hypothetical protein
MVFGITNTMLFVMSSILYCGCASLHLIASATKLAGWHESLRSIADSREQAVC